MPTVTQSIVTAHVTYHAKPASVQVRGQAHHTVDFTWTVYIQDLEMYTVFGFLYRIRTMDQILDFKKYIGSSDFGIYKIYTYRNKDLILLPSPPPHNTLWQILHRPRHISTKVNYNAQLNTHSDQQKTAHKQIAFKPIAMSK